jgi:hypothetical protein
MATPSQVAASDVPQRSTMRRPAATGTNGSTEAPVASLGVETGDSDGCLLPVLQKYPVSCPTKQNIQEATSTADQTIDSMRLFWGEGEEDSLNPTISEYGSIATLSVDSHLKDKQLLGPPRTVFCTSDFGGQEGDYEESEGFTENRDDTNHSEPFRLVCKATEIAIGNNVSAASAGDTHELTESESSTPKRTAPIEKMIAPQNRNTDKKKDDDDPTDKINDNDNCTTVLENGIPRVIYLRSFTAKRGHEIQQLLTNRRGLSRLLRRRPMLFQKKKEFLNDSDSECYRQTLVSL